MINFTIKQWITLITISVISACVVACLSVEAPFYPTVAAEKGCSALEFGFVFSVLELVIFLTSPLIGHHFNRIGIKITLIAGVYIICIFSVLFGLVNYINGRILFLSTSIAIKVMQAIGFGAFLTATPAIIAQEFSADVGTATALCELAIGIGLVCGTIGGGILVDLEGYSKPFLVYGLILCIVTTCSIFILPKSETNRNLSNSLDQDSILKVLKIPGVLLAVIASVIGTMAIGFLQATLEPYMQQFNLSSFALGIVFSIPRIIFSFTILIFGRICDKYVSPKIIVVCGTICQCIAFCVIGPAPFIPLKLSLPLLKLGLVFHGFGISMQQIGTLTDALQTTLANGFENNTKTNGLVFGIWTSSGSLGHFVGPCLGGILLDTVGFRNASMLIFGSQFLLAIALLIYVCNMKLAIPYEEIQNEDHMHVNSKFVKVILVRP